MRNERLALAAVTFTLAVAASACDAQTTPDYPGSKLLTIHGTIAGELPDAEIVPALAFTDLNTGDHLTAVIVTTHPPKVMTQRQVDASLASAAAPAAARAPAAAPAAPTRMAAATPVAAPAAPERQLPKTASLLPLIAAVGSGSTLLGLGLAMLRRRRAA